MTHRHRGIRRKSTGVREYAMNSTSDVQLQDLLSAVTDALLMGDEQIDEIISRYRVPRSQVDGLVSIIRHLHVALVGVQPSGRFSRRLYEDLMGSQRWTLVTRMRRMPARVQIAALLALVAGFMLIARRRLIADTASEVEEAPAL